MKQEKFKDYKTMTAEEQLQFVTDFDLFVTERLPRLKLLGSNWTLDDRKDMEKALRMLGSFAFSRDFAAKGLYYGDYAARLGRMEFYADLVKKEVAKGVMVQGSDGQAFAYVPSMKQQFRRRGRPTREEALAMQREQPTDVETKRQQAIAKLLGVEIVTSQTMREKNNDELRQEREERERKEAERHPTLFAGQAGQAQKGTAPATDGKESGAADNTPTPAPADRGNSTAGYEAAMGVNVDDKPYLHLDQLKWLMSKKLADEVAQVRMLRSTAAAAAEKAKTLAEQGANSDEIAPYARQAAEDTEHYEAIYEAVDRELAEVFVRLKEDDRYVAALQKRHNGKVDVSLLSDMLKPYFQKMTPDFLPMVRRKIDEEQPERVAQREAEQKLKDEVDGIIKYIKRQDKPNTDKRIAGLEEKYARLVELKGHEFADAYLPFIAKAKEDNARLNAEKEAAKADKNKKTAKK